MAKTRLLVVGAGGHGRSVAKAAKLSGQFEVVGLGRFAVYRKTGSGCARAGACGKHGPPPSCGGTSHCCHRQQRCAREVDAAIGRSGFRFSDSRSPRAIVSPRAVLCASSAVMAGAIVGTEARLGISSIVNCGAVVDHYATVEDFGHLGVNASMAGGTVLGRGAWMQAGAALGYGVRLAAGEVFLPGAAR